MKIREILPALDKATTTLSRMSGDAATLELTDSDQASRRLKKALSDFEHGELAALKKIVSDVREVINTRPKRKIKNGGINIGKALAVRAEMLGNPEPVKKAAVKKDYEF